MPEIIARECTFDLAARAAGMDECCIPAVLSTDAPVAMSIGGRTVNEVLDHSPKAVDLSRFPLPLVEEHDNAKTALAVAESPTLEGGKLRAMIRFGSQARAIEVLRDVKAGIVRSLSIYYQRLNTVRESDSAVRTAKWIPMHVSPVGTPADAGAGFFRSEQPQGEVPATSPRNITMPDPIVPAKPDVPVIDAAAIRADSKEIAGIARSLNLNADDFCGLDKSSATAEMLKAVAARAAKALPEPVAVATPPARITADHADKQVAAFSDAMLSRSGLKAIDKQNPYSGRSMTDMAIKYAKSMGVRSAEDWTKKDAAHFILGENSQVSGMRGDSANITTGNFTSFVMLDAITKIVIKGYESQPSGLTSNAGNKIYDTQTVPDFKSFRLGGMGTANLIETVENTAFPELVKTDGVYSDTAKMWGGTLSLSIQALVNDDTGAFDRSLKQSGAIAAKTQEKRLVQKFLRGIATIDLSTWTNNTTAGCTLVYTTGDTISAARANISRAGVAMMNRIGLDGNPTGNMPKFLLCGPTNSLYARGLLTSVGGQVVGNWNWWSLPGWKLRL
jgi:hypothetical protein